MPGVCSSTKKHPFWSSAVAFSAATNWRRSWAFPALQNLRLFGLSQQNAEYQAYFKHAQSAIWDLIFLLASWLRSVNIGKHENWVFILDQKKTVLSKSQKPSGTIPSRCSPKHSLFFFPPNVCYLHAQWAATILSLSSVFSFRLPCPLFLSFFFSYLIGPWVDLFNTQHCAFRSIVYHERICLSWCLWLKGLLLVWQKHLKGKLVNNLNKHIGQGILEIFMPQRWVYKMYLNWEIITNDWWNPCQDRRQVCCTHGVTTQTDKADKLSRSYQIRKTLQPQGSSRWGILDCCSCSGLCDVKNGDYFSIRLLADSVLHQQQPSLLNKKKITYVMFCIHEA